MNLEDYIKSGYSRQIQLAKAVGVQRQLMYQWVRSRRPVPIERCVAIERATGGVVTRRDLRPDDWWKIWPELADSTIPRPDVSADIPRPASGVETERACGDE